MLRTIKLYGAMGKRFGKVHRLDVHSTMEVFRALRVTCQGFEQYLRDCARKGMGFEVLDGKRAVYEAEVENPLSREEIRISPRIQGAKRAGVLQTIIGAAMFVAGIALAVIPNPFSWAGPYIAEAGFVLMVGGIIQMLTPLPKVDEGDGPNNRRSYYFNGPTNNVAQGGPVYVGYGEMLVGGAPVSATIDVAEVTA